MNRMFSLAAGFADALSLMAGPAVTAHAADYNGPKIKFRVAHTTPPGNHITLAFEKFKELVEQKSGGKVRIEGHRRGSGGYVDITFSVTVGSRE